MDQKTRPAPRLAPLPIGTIPEVVPTLEIARKRMGFVPNSQLTMQRVPRLLEGYAKLSQAIWDPAGTVDRKLKLLISLVASRTSGCQYCTAHTAEGAAKIGTDQAKIDAVWDYQHSPLFDAAERAALDVAVGAACVPNAVTDAMFATLRQHWSDEQVVEIIGVIALFGFLNRWNDTFATPLEDEPIEYGEAHLASQGWDPAKHLR